MSQTELRDAAQKVLPRGVVARTGDALVKTNKADLDEILGFLNTFLLVFAAVSLVVGTFLIVNTFSILVAQRSRELALLRALGASRRQVNVSVLVEALGRRAVRIHGRPRRRATSSRAACSVLFGAVGFDLSRAHVPGQPAHGRGVVRRGAAGHAGGGLPPGPAGLARSRRSRRCATTSPCPSRRCAAASLVGLRPRPRSVPAGWPSGFDQAAATPDWR